MLKTIKVHLEREVNAEMDHKSPEWNLDLGFVSLTFNLSTVMMLLVTAVIVFLIAFISTRRLALSQQECKTSWSGLWTS